MIRPLLLGLVLGCGALAVAAPSDPPSRTPARPTAAQQFELAVTLLENRGDARAALSLFQAVASAGDRGLAARALVYVGLCHERLGNEQAAAVYERVLRDFADQRAAVAQARSRLTALTAARPSRAALTLRRLWDGMPVPGGEIGSASADGRLFALLSPTGELTLQDAGTLRLRPPVPLGQAAADRGACQPSGPVLAPDASAVAYVCWGPQGGELRVASSSARGSERVLHRATGSDSIEVLEWRRREALLARIDGATHSQVVLVSAGAASEVRVITTLPFRPGGVSISPDHRWLALDAPDAQTPPRRDVMLVPVDGGPTRMLAGGDSDDHMPLWAPDGRAVAWISDRTGTSALWMQRVANGTPAGSPALLAPDLGRVAYPMALTTTGTYLYFRQVGHVDVHTVGLDGAGDVIGAPVVDGTRYVGATMSPTFSPNVRQLAYRVELGVSRSHAIGIRDLDTRRERIITPAMGWIGLPRWSPDGTRLLVRGRDAAGRYGFFLVDADTAATTPVLVVPPAEEDQLGPGQWDRDGRGIVFVKQRRFVRRDLATGADAVFSELPDGASPAALPDAGFVISRTDGSLAYLQRSNGVTSLHVRTPDGVVRDVFRSGRDERLSSIAWLPDNRGLIFVRAAATADAAPPPAIWRIDAAGGDPRPLGVSMRGLRDVVVSADGRTLAFTGGWPTREPWVVEHLPIGHTAPPGGR